MQRYLMRNVIISFGYIWYFPSLHIYAILVPGLGSRFGTVRGLQVFLVFCFCLFAGIFGVELADFYMEFIVLFRPWASGLFWWLKWVASDFWLVVLLVPGLRVCFSLKWAWAGIILRLLDFTLNYIPCSSLCTELLM